MAEPLYSLAGKRVFVTGHRGMVGSALLRRLEREPVAALLTAPREAVDLTDQTRVGDWMAEHRPDCVFHAAGRVGGILANASYPADFLYDNLMMACTVIHAAHAVGVEKLAYFGSSCIYPKFAEQPITEDALLTGMLEPTNEAYAIAKIAGLKLCEAYRRQHGADFIALMPTNLYGPGDNFDPDGSHVIPALMRKAHEAKTSGHASMTIWGTGTPRREFLHVDDLADASVHLMQHYSDAAPINVGTGVDVTIADLAQTIMRAVGFEGGLETDPSKPDGTPRKQLDVGRLNALGWDAARPLDRGLRETYAWFLDNAHALRGL